MQNENLNEIINEVEYLDYASFCVKVYGEYVNNHRSIPNVFDGLKPSYRRLIYAAIQLKGKHSKTDELVSEAGKHHAHGIQSLVPIVSFLVRNGIFDGQGSFGGNLMNGGKVKSAAPRYTAAWINPKYQQLFNKLLKYVPYYKGEYGHLQPHYLPTPVPLCYVFGNFGIGIGCTVKIPSFTIKSMLLAYLKDDPKLLEASYGLQMDKSSLKNIWEGGEGYIEYKMKLEELEYNGMKAIAIRGNPEKFSPFVNDDLDWYLSNGWVGKIDLTTGKGSNIDGNLVYFIKNNNKVTVEDLKYVLEECSTYGELIKSRASFNGVVYSIGLRDWIDICYKNYIKIFETYKSDNIQRLETQIPIYENLEAVTKLILDKKSKQQIKEELGLEDYIVDSICRKSIGTLMNFNVKNKLDSINSQINNIKSLNGDKYISDTFIDDKLINLEEVEVE